MMLDFAPFPQWANARLASPQRKQGSDSPLLALQAGMALLLHLLEQLIILGDLALLGVAQMDEHRVTQFQMLTLGEMNEVFLVLFTLHGGEAGLGAAEWVSGH